MPAECHWTRDDRPTADDTPQQVKVKIRRRQRKAELRRKWYEQNAWHRHARHRTATDLRSTAGMDLAKIQLGHTTEKMTRRYAQADFDQAIEHAD